MRETTKSDMIQAECIVKLVQAKKMGVEEAREMLDLKYNIII